MRLRNTYQVPAGQKVTVDTPQGQKTYGGGQYVPPEQLANARTAQADPKKGPPKGGQAAQAAGPGWDEIVMEFKNVDISDNKSTNIASYKIKQFLPLDVDVSSNKIHPACRFGAELTVANIVNSLPPLKDMLAQVKVLLIHPSDSGPIVDRAVGKEFTRVGEIDFQENAVKYWQHEQKPEDLIQNVSKFVGAKLGILVIRNLYMQKEDYQKNEKDNKQKLEQLQVVIKRKIHDLSSGKKKGAPPERGTDEELDEMMDQMQQLTTQEQLMSVLIPTMDKLEVSVKREGGINPYIQHILDGDTKEGTIQQFCNILSSSNSMSLSGNNTFSSSMEKLSADYPDTLSCIKKIMDILTEISNQGQEEEE